MAVIIQICTFAFLYENSKLFPKMVKTLEEINGYYPMYTYFFQEKRFTTYRTKRTKMPSGLFELLCFAIFTSKLVKKKSNGKAYNLKDTIPSCLLYRKSSKSRSSSSTAVLVFDSFRLMPGDWVSKKTSPVACCWKRTIYGQRWDTETSIPYRFINFYVAHRISYLLTDITAHSHLIAQRH